ncbi:MAG: lytic transglycosylase domain-containing protein [Deltaproteobacteria bacterium]|nr:lytic transglycosylase domain-containing protein [Deltaproteobacteria bacterium]
MVGAGINAACEAAAARVGLGRRRAGALAAAVLLAAAPAWGKPPPDYLWPDPLAAARAQLRAGDLAGAAHSAMTTQTPQGRLLAGLALLSAGDDTGAVAQFAAIPPTHILWDTSEPLRAQALRRLGRFDDARAAVAAMQRRALPGTRYVEADVDHAGNGCAAAPAYARALAAEPGHAGRHGARRVLLRCTAGTEARVSLALDMLDDAEPQDAMLARAALQAAVEGGGRLDVSLALRLADRLTLERLPALVERVLTALPPPATAEEALRRDLLLAGALGALDRRAEKLALLAKVQAAPAGAETPAVWRSVLAARAADLSPRELAEANLQIAEKFPLDPLSIENRHLAGYYFSEAGDLAAALAQWERVAAVRNAKQKDAAWFTARTLAALGRVPDASKRALQWARPAAVGPERAAHFRYWGAVWTAQAGRADDGNRHLEELCRTLPVRLYGRLACQRLGRPPTLPQAPAPLPDDAMDRIVALRTGKLLSAAARERLARVAALYQSGATTAASDTLRGLLSSERAAPDGLLALGELALAMGDATAAVQLAERQRALVDGGKDARWLRLAYPRVAVVEASARAEGLDQDLALAIARTESHFSPVVRSKAGAMGVMQLMPTTAAGLVGAGEPALEDGALFDAATNTRLGARYLARLWADFGGRPELAAAAYNGGPEPARRFVERGRGLPLDAFMEAVNYRETRLYVKRVLEAYANYRAARGLDAGFRADRVMDVVPGGAVNF